VTFLKDQPARHRGAKKEKRATAPYERKKKRESGKNLKEDRLAWKLGFESNWKKGPTSNPDFKIRKSR